MISVAVLGYSDTGKTTCIEALAAEMERAGITTAVVKYSSHPGSFDTPGSDTFRFAATSARFVAYRGQKGWFISVPAAPASELAEIPPWMIPLADTVDLLILEGRRLPGSTVCLMAGNAETVEELKYPVEIADVVVTSSLVLSETIRPRRDAPFVATSNDEATREVIRIIQTKGAAK